MGRAASDELKTEQSWGWGFGPRPASEGGSGYHCRRRYCHELGFTGSYDRGAEHNWRAGGHHGAAVLCRTAVTPQSVVGRRAVGPPSIRLRHGAHPLAVVGGADTSNAVARTTRGQALRNEHVREKQSRQSRDESPQDHRVHNLAPRAVLMAAFQRRQRSPGRQL